MNSEWDEYRRICDEPDVFTRWALHVTADLLEDAKIVTRIRRVLRLRPLPKPVDHKGDHRTDMFRLDFTGDEIAEIVSVIGSFPSPTSNALAGSPSGTAGLLRTWQLYLEHAANLER